MKATQVGVCEASPEPFQLFQSHKGSLKVRAAKRVRLSSYEKKCARLWSQGANGAELFAIDRTKAAIRYLRIKLSISLASVNAMSPSTMSPQLAELNQMLARMWRLISDVHRVMKRMADEVSVLLSLLAAWLEGGIKGLLPRAGHAHNLY